MFGIGPTELIVILVIALLVLGPKRLPELAAGLGKGLAEFRRATADINAELDQARRSVEEPAREAARGAQPERRVSRTTKRAPLPSEAEEASVADHGEHPAAQHAGADHAARDHDADEHEGETIPKAPA